MPEKGRTGPTEGNPGRKLHSESNIQSCDTVPRHSVRLKTGKRIPLDNQNQCILHIDKIDNDVSLLEWHVKLDKVTNPPVIIDAAAYSIAGKGHFKCLLKANDDSIHTIQVTYLIKFLKDKRNRVYTKWVKTVLWWTSDNP
ncbi:MAG: hypothetical protein J7K00_03085 [Candidatus Diapherotrites archaeon]|nr:hypothetical protein [Candidatus Diapherotrites archaeon]